MMYWPVFGLVILSVFHVAGAWSLPLGILSSHTTKDKRLPKISNELKAHLCYKGREKSICIGQDAYRILSYGCMRVTDLEYIGTRVVSAAGVHRAVGYMYYTSIFCRWYLLHTPTGTN